MVKRVEKAEEAAVRREAVVAKVVVVEGGEVEERRDKLELS